MLPVNIDITGEEFNFENTQTMDIVETQHDSHMNVSEGGVSPWIEVSKSKNSGDIIIKMLLNDWYLLECQRP